MSKRPWVVLFLLVAISAAFVLSVTLLVPREPGELEQGRDDTFRYSFDPHLFISLHEVSLQRGQTAFLSVRAKIVASNTATADLTLDLSSLRVALETSNGEILEAIAPEWQESSQGVVELQPDSKAEAELDLLATDGRQPVAILVWQDYSFLRFLPQARGSVLCPTLRLPLGEPVTPDQKSD